MLMKNKFSRVIRYAEFRNLFPDFKYSKTILIHLDGSIFDLTYGCYEKYNLENMDFIILYGEHYHPMVFFADDVTSVTGEEIIRIK